MIDHVSVAVAGLDAGAPTDREGAQTPFFGTFIFDMDGNRIEVVIFPRKDAE